MSAVTFNIELLLYWYSLVLLLILLGFIVESNGNYYVMKIGRVESSSTGNTITNSSTIASTERLVKLEMTSL